MTELRRKVVSGFFWNVLQTGVSRGVGLLTTMVLLLYLDERAFGLVAVAGVVISAIEAFSDAGLTKELVYRKDRLEEASNTAFTILILLNLALYGLLLIAGPIVTYFTEDPEVTPIVNWMGIGLVLSGAGMVPLAILQRKLMFRETAIREISGQLVGATVAVVMAMNHYGVSTLVARQLAAFVVMLGLVWWVCPYRPRFGLDLSLARSMVHYGKHMVAASIVTILVYNLVPAVGAVLLGVSAVGFYAVAMTLADVPQRLVSRAAVQVLFPVFSRMQDDRAALGRGYLKGLRTIGAVIIPAQFALGVLGPSLMEAIYGDKWTTSGRLLPILAAYGLFLGLTVLSGEVFKATGHPWYVSFYSIVHLVVLAALIIALASWLGLVGLAIATAGAMGVRFVVETFRVGRIVGIPAARIFATSLKPFLCSAVVFGSIAFLMGSHIGLGQVILWVLGGGLFYAGSMWVIDRKFFVETLQAMKVVRTEA